MAEGDASLEPGRILGRYRIVRELGSGGMGAVYEAVHTGLNKRVAMKVLHPAVDRDASIRARFLREGEVAARIRHPHVVDVHDVATEGGVSFLVMDYLEGEDLAALLKREGPLSAERTAEILLPVLDAIHAAHEAGVIHRDLKPANIYLTRGRDGALSPQVLDFGISKILQEQPAEALTRTGMVMGTPNYMAPEQVHGAKDLDGRSDVYALGAIAYECVVGRRAFDGGTLVDVLVRIAQNEYPRPRSVRVTVPEDLEALIVRCMSGQRGARPESARAMMALLLPFASPLVAARWASALDPDEGLDDTPLSDGPRLGAARLDAARLDAARLDAARLDAGAGSRSSGARPGDARPAPASASVSAEAPGGGPSTLGDARPLTANLSATTAAPSLRGPVIGLTAALVGAVAAWWMLLRTPPAVVSVPVSPPPRGAPATFEVAVTVQPPTATIHLDGQPVGSGGRLAVSLPRDGRVHRLSISAPGFAPHESSFVDGPPPASIVLVPVGTNDAPIIY